MKSKKKYNETDTGIPSQSIQRTVYKCVTLVDRSKNISVVNKVYEREYYMNFIDRIFKRIDNVTRTKIEPSGSEYGSISETFGSILTAHINEHKGVYTSVFAKERKLTEKEYRKIEDSIEMLRWKGMTVDVDYRSNQAVVTVLM
ncbi:hypothetical protein MZM54_05050 [[Brevibacterium] frigoritolerans]|nr:hypothetical protein [Peribacillus frigoritolerans]